jgi:hypothetical protein
MREICTSGSMRGGALFVPSYSTGSVSSSPASAASPSTQATLSMESTQLLVQRSQHALQAYRTLREFRIDPWADK